MVAQLTAAIALIAAVTMPGWSEVSGTAPAAPATPAVPSSPATSVTPPPPAAVPADTRPAHLNLDVRHRFRHVDLTVTVDGKRALDTRLEGNGKKFGVFGGRGERQFTRTLDLRPGDRVVTVRLRSTDEKFDHTRAERFELNAAAVATMRIGVDKNGLDVMTDRPPVAAAPPVLPVTASTLPLAPNAPAATASPASASAAPAQGGMVVELYQTLRRLLIALAGFIASVAAAYLLEEFLKSRHVSFAAAAPPAPPHRKPNVRIAAE